jgi:Sap, sulfolipid-1-addressing protein
LNGSSDLLEIFALALIATANPSLLAAVTVMLLLPHPKRLMLGYLLGAYTTSVVAGVAIVFALHGTSAESVSRHKVSPLEDLFVGLLLVAIAWILRTGHDQPLRERRRKKKERELKAKEAAGKPTESLPLRMLGKGDPRVTFLVGAALSFPGVSYLAALDRIHRLDAGIAPSVLLIVCFCVMQQILLELPLLGYLFAPDRTRQAVAGFKESMARRGRTAATIGAAAIGIVLITRGVITLL